MRTFIAFVMYITCLLVVHAEYNEESRKNEAEQVAYWEDQLAKAKSMPELERPSALWVGLKNMGYRRSISGHSSAVDEIYHKIQLELVGIPGHAEYFANRIREAYEPLKGPDPKAAINRAQRETMFGFQALKHLPSPENVKVLGEMLSETWELPSQGEFTPPALAQSAVITLGGLGIREAPWRPIITTSDLPGALPAWQTWWEQVKSGRRAFSFKGQSVEYRFNFDGSWEATSLLNPPDDGPKSPKAESADRKQPAESLDAKGISTQSDSWPWIVSGTIVLLVIGLWLWVKRR